jgi:hypothetical protein
VLTMKQTHVFLQVNLCLISKMKGMRCGHVKEEKKKSIVRNNGKEWMSWWMDRNITKAELTLKMAASVPFGASATFRKEPQVH